MPDRPLRAVLPLLAGLLVAGAALAVDDPPAADLPTPPSAASLLPLDAGPMAAHRFFIDASSLSLSAEREVRYTVVIDAAGGARTIRFEGIDCVSREYLIHAVGRSDGAWRRVTRVERRPIEVVGINLYQATLHDDYFCAFGNVRDGVEVLRAALRDGNHRSVPGGR